MYFFLIAMCLGFTNADTVTGSIAVLGKPMNEVCFVPAMKSSDEKCLPRIIDVISKTQSSLYIGIYAFGSKEIAQTIVQLPSNVKVQIVFDKYTVNSKWGKVVISILQARKGIELFKANTKGNSLFHNKFMIFDENVVQTGSINYSDNGFFRNYENMLMISDDSIVSKYIEYFEYVRNAATRI